MTARACAYVSSSPLPCFAIAVGDQFKEGSRSQAVTTDLTFPSSVRTQQWLAQGCLGDIRCQLNLNICSCFLKPGDGKQKRTEKGQTSHSLDLPAAFGSGSKGHVALYPHQDGACLHQPRNRGVGLLRCGCTTARESWLGSFLPIALHGCICILGAKLHFSFVLIKNLPCNLSAYR